MHTILYGARCGAALAVVPGAVIALALYLLSFSFMDRSLVKGPVLCMIVTGVTVIIGAAAGAVVGGLVEGFRLLRRKSQSGRRAAAFRGRAD